MNYLNIQRTCFGNRPLATSSAGHGLLGDTQTMAFHLNASPSTFSPSPPRPLVMYESAVALHYLRGARERNGGPREQMRNAPEIKLLVRIQRIKKRREKHREG